MCRIQEAVNSQEVSGRVLVRRSSCETGFEYALSNYKINLYKLQTPNLNQFMPVQNVNR